MANHKNLPFSQLHISKIRNGLFADKPPAPQGAGDVYYCTDTFQLFFGLDAFTWQEFLSGGGGPTYEGVRWYLGSNSTVSGDNSPNYIHWDSESWQYGGTFGSPGDLILTPLIAIYRWTASLLIDNSVTGTWTFNVWSDDFTVLQTHTLITDGSGDPVELNISGESLSNIQQPTTGAWFYIDAAQNSGGNLNILIGSNITYSIIGVHA